MEDISGGMFGDAEYFKPLVDGVNDMSVGNDWFLLANDFADYMRAQEVVDATYKDQSEWTRRWEECQEGWVARVVEGGVQLLIIRLQRANLISRGGEAPSQSDTG
jgi:hypothetical protein